MKRRTVLILTGIFILSVTLLALAHYGGDPSWIRHHLSVAHGSDGILWQVQTTFLSVGFAGLAIAVQLFAEAPLAIGASRGQVLEHIKAGWFVGVGLVANAIIAVETMWLPSGLGVLGAALLGLTPTVVMLVVSTTRLMQLFGNPSRLDRVVRTSLVGTISQRLRDVSSKYADAKRQLERLSGAELSVGVLEPLYYSLRVLVPEGGRIIRMIRPDVVRKAIEPLRLRATERNLNRGESSELFEPFRVTIGVAPGDRTRLGDPAFEVVTSRQLDEATSNRMMRHLQSSIVFEPASVVTPYEEIDREIAHLKDAIGTNLRSGALATAERALVLLGDVVRGVWITEPAMLDLTWRASMTRRDWLFRSIGEVEQDALLSPRTFGMFVIAGTTRALEASRTGPAEYVDECLRSFTRLWFDVLQHGGPEFASVPSSITTRIQNLTAYSFSVAEEREDLQARGTWAMVELVKLALDAKRPDAAKVAAWELDGLFEYDREGTGRSHVRGGQMVLSGWLDYLADKKDERDPEDPELRNAVTPAGTVVQIIAARRLTERGTAPFSRWDWWEMKTTAASRAQFLELSRYVDRAQLAALSSWYGPLPPVGDQETASEYRRFLDLLGESDAKLTAKQESLKQKFAEGVAEWGVAEAQKLAEEPLSVKRVDELRVALRETLAERPRLADEIPVAEEVPTGIDTSRHVLGMNLRVPRHYLVDEVFNQTYADPKDLGRAIGRGFIDGEDRKIVEALRSLHAHALEPTGAAIRSQIEALRGEAEHYVLVTSYGGLDVFGGGSSAIALGRVTHVETGVLDDDEAIFFDRRETLASYRKPEEKADLDRVEGTSIALGVFDDARGGEEPQVRLETGEYLVVWPGENPRIVRFGGGQAFEPPDSSGPTDADL